MKKDNTTTDSILPNQRVSKAERRKPDWYIPTIDYIINKALTLNSKTKEDVESDLLAAEGIIDNKTYDYVTKAFGIQDPAINLPSQVRDVSLILPIERRYMGEYIRQYKRFQVYHKGIDAIKQRNKQLALELEQLIAQEVVNTLNQNIFLLVVNHNLFLILILLSKNLKKNGLILK
jgi:hypothetical protein